MILCPGRRVNGVSTILRDHDVTPPMRYPQAPCWSLVLAAGLLLVAGQRVRYPFPLSPPRNAPGPVRDGTPVDTMLAITLYFDRQGAIVG